MKNIFLKITAQIILIQIKIVGNSNIINSNNLNVYLPNVITF